MLSSQIFEYILIRKAKVASLREQKNERKVLRSKGYQEKVKITRKQIKTKSKIKLAAVNFRAE